jgi:glutamine amidotransferase
MKPMGLLDLGLSNLDSIARAIEECGARPVRMRDPSELTGVDAVIFPGVGTFGAVRNALIKVGWPKPLGAFVETGGKPLLGICVGLQLLADRGEEADGGLGLGWVPGTVLRLVPQSDAERLPHIGWNRVMIERDDPLFSGIDDGAHFYFLHSYHLVCAQPHHILARTPYCGQLTAAVRHRNVWGVQFHPEKSQKVGLRLLKNFIELA